MRRVKLEIGATPDDGLLKKRRFQRAVHPSATTPVRRSRIPIRMVIKGYQNEWCGDLAQPNRGEMMEIARAVKRERGHLSSDLLEERMVDAARCAVSRFATPTATI